LFDWESRRAGEQESRRAGEQERFPSEAMK
jgi:hypothetical protein